MVDSQVRQPYNKSKVVISLLFAVCFFVSCSSLHLKKFEDGNLSQEISKEIAEKFEVKEMPAQISSAEPIIKTPIKKPKHETKHEKQKLQPQVAELPPSRSLPVMPFKVGERLQYDIRYLGVTAGYLNFEVLPEKEVNQRVVYHLRGAARTVKLFELVYRVNDVIESFWDFDGLYSHRFTLTLDETKQSRKSVELYDYDKNKSYIWNRIDHADKGLSESKAEYDIAKWSQDILSALYYIRVAKLPTEPNQEFRFSVIMDGKPWESVITFSKKSKMYAAGQNFDVNVYSLVNYFEGQPRNKENTVWISDDEHRYLLRVETKIKVGSFAVALDKIL